jgi:mycofactocin system glycosyltransferase
VSGSPGDGVPDDDGIPTGWCLALDHSVRRTEQGRVVVGGTPLRVLQLSPPGARVVDALVGGEPVPASPAARHLSRRLVDAGLAHPRPPSPAGPPLDQVTVVIPVRDMTAGLTTTLAALAPLRDAVDVVVVDDGSRDPDAVRVAAGDARVLRHERALGPASAREHGWRATTRPIVAFVDAEVAPDDPDWLARLLPHFGDPQVGAVAPRVRATRGVAPDLLARYEQVRSALDRGTREAIVRPGSAVPYVPTTALVVRRRALETVGGFDPALRVGEDVDLVWRLHEHGWRVRYDPRVAVTHPCRSTWSAWLRQRVAYGRSAAALARRHGDAAAPLALSPWTGAAAAAVVSGHLAPAAALGAARVVAVRRRLPEFTERDRTAARIGGRDLASGARRVADALRGPWWPIAIGLAAVSRRARPAVLAAVVVPAVLDARARHPRVDPLRFGLLHLADDVAYGTGVWLGCARERSVRALLPVVASGRREQNPRRPAARKP